MILHGKCLVKSFGTKKVINNVDFKLEPGTITAIVGRNGSGKTTILKLLASVLKADEGCVLIDEQNINNFPALKTHIAYLPDRFNFFEYESIGGAMDYYKIIYPDFDTDFANKEIEAIGLGMKDSIRSLSKGNKALVGLVFILASQADFVLVDEILDGMDVLNKEKIIQYLLDSADRGKAILVSSHELEELEGIADRIIYLGLDGQIKKLNSMDESNVVKIQVVTKDLLPKIIKERAIVRQNIGRVYTIIAKGDKGIWREFLKDEGVVQYDFLSPRLEDLFYLERGGVESNDNI